MASRIWFGLVPAAIHGRKHLDDFFGEDARKYLYSHLSGALKFIPYGTMVDHFQHEVYAHPEMTPEERHACWRKLEGIYRPWMKLDGDICTVYSRTREPEGKELLLSFRIIDNK